MRWSQGARRAEVQERRSKEVVSRIRRKRWSISGLERYILYEPPMGRPKHPRFYGKFFRGPLTCSIYQYTPEPHIILRTGFGICSRPFINLCVLGRVFVWLVVYGLDGNGRFLFLVPSGAHCVGLPSPHQLIFFTGIPAARTNVVSRIRRKSNSSSEFWPIRMRGGRVFHNSIFAAKGLLISE